MQTATTTFIDKLKKSYSASSTPRITVEWNGNRFGTIETVNNNGVEVTDDDPSFPIESIISPRRPKKSGIFKGIVSTGTDGREARAYKASEIPVARRMYTASPDAKYKYWISPNRSSSTLSNGGYSLSNCVPTVIYRYGIRVNRLVAQFENTGANPIDVVFEYSTNGTTWQQAGATYTPSSNGRIELYLQDDGSWSKTENINNYLAIKGLRVKVTKMSRPSARCHVIEIATMHKMDFTDRTISFSTGFNNSEASFVAPLGKAETATGSLELSNVDGFLDNDRVGGNLMYGRMNSPAEVVITNTTVVGGSTAKTNVATMFVENWGDYSDESRSLSLSDASMFLKQEYPPEMLLENVTGTELIWRLLDSVGFADFIVDESPDGDMKVRYFWTDPEKTVWEHIREISEGLQIAVYFNESGMLMIRARERMYEKDPSAPVWVFDGQEVSSALATEQGRPGDAGKLPDIVSMTRPNELVANKVTVEYATTDISSSKTLQPKMEQVWAPEGTVALRTANLKDSMTSTQPYILLTDSNFATWPYEGYIQVNGEIMKWTKKRYKYVDASGAYKVKYVASDAEKDALDGLNSARSHTNQFDGCMYIGENRGMMSTYPRSHSVNHKFTGIRHRHKNGPVIEKTSYTNADYRNSVFRIKTNANFGVNSWLVARKGIASDAPPTYMGTSIKFDKGSAYSQGSAGLLIGGRSKDAGYYIELSTTSYVSKRRKYVNEVGVYIRKDDGTFSRVGKGAVVGVSKNKWYDIDVFQKKVGSDFEITVAVNGVTAIVTSIPSSRALSSEMGGIYGVFARGHTHVSFEYLYAATSSEMVSFSDDDASRWDLIDGGYRSKYYNYYLYNKKANERLTKKSVSRLNRNFGFSFDEFGTKAHEIREFDVTFDPAPVVHSRLYMSNEWYADCVEYVSDSNSAKFIVVGKGRDNVIINGEDTLLYGKDNPVDQKLLIYGRVVTVEDTQNYEVTNEKSIRRTGPVELTVSSPWIQSESSAKKIGDWIADHWANGSESIEIETFGNPLLQVGDVVSVCYTRKKMLPESHQYYITGVSQSYNEGLSTSYRLQRKTDLTS